MAGHTPHIVENARDMQGSRRLSWQGLHRPAQPLQLQQKRGATRRPCMPPPPLPWPSETWHTNWQGPLKGGVELPRGTTGSVWDMVPLPGRFSGPPGAAPPPRGKSKALVISPCCQAATLCASTWGCPAADHRMPAPALAARIPLTSTSQGAAAAMRLSVRNCFTWSRSARALRFPVDPQACSPGP